MILDMTDEDIIKTLAGDNDDAIKILNNVLTSYPNKFRTLALDLEDMQMSGEQILEAYNYCASVLDFIKSCENRDELMVAVVNMHCTEKTARAHGEQKTLPKVDEAVAGILKDAENSGNLKRLDEGAEAIHALFKTMLNEMQRSRVFTANFRLNLDGAGWAKFQVALVELQNPDGSPYKIQPKDEVANMVQPEEGAQYNMRLEPTNVTITPGTGVDNNVNQIRTSGAIDGSLE